MKDFAFAISVYDRWDDVAALVDILRENWKGDYYIAVCSSHPDAAAHLSKYPLDALLSTEKIIFDPKTNLFRRAATISLRVIDSIRKSCGHCCEYSGAPYTMHLHADACPLSPSGIDKLTQQMKSMKKGIAARGYGFVHYTHDGPLGDFDDMFFVTDNALALKSGLWNFDLPDVLPHKISMHGFLPLRFLSCIGLSRVFHYSEYADAVYWDGKPIHYTYDMGYSSRPMYFDLKYDLLHIHTQDFPGDLGPRLKAYYFQRYGLTNGPFLRNYVRQWGGDSNALFRELELQLDRLYRFFRQRLLFAEKKYGRDFSRMHPLCDEYERLGKMKKLEWFVRMQWRQVQSLMRPLKSQLQNALFGELYGDSIWPRSVDSLYRDLEPYLQGVEEFRGVSFDGAS